MRMNMQVPELHAITAGLAAIVAEGLQRRPAAAMANRWSEVCAVQCCQELHARLIASAARSWGAKGPLAVKVTPAQGAALLYMTKHDLYHHVLSGAVDRDPFFSSTWDGFIGIIHRQMIND